MVLAFLTTVFEGAMESPIMAYLVVLAILILDAGQSSVFGNPGAVGGFFSWVFSMATGLNFAFETWQLLFIFAVVVPLLFFIKMAKQ